MVVGKWVGGRRGELTRNGIEIVQERRPSPLGRGRGTAMDGEGSARKVLLGFK